MCLESPCDGRRPPASLLLRAEDKPRFSSPAKNNSASADPAALRDRTPFAVHSGRRPAPKPQSGGTRTAPRTVGAGKFALRVGVSAPVVERSVPVLGQSIGLAGTLHLHNAQFDRQSDPGIGHVASPRSALRRSCSFHNRRTVRSDRFAPQLLRASVDAPLLRELREATADLLAGDSHSRRGQTASCCARSGTA